MNADIFCDTGSNTPLSTNMFAYCENNPVMYSDPTGYWKTNDHRTLCRENGFSGGYYKTVRDWAENADKSPCENSELYNPPFHGLGLYEINGLIRAMNLYNWALELKFKPTKEYFHFPELSKKPKGNIKFLMYKHKENYTKETEEAQNQLAEIFNSAKNATEQSKILLGLTLHLIQDYFAHMIQIESIYEVKKSPIKNLERYEPIFRASKNAGTKSMYKFEDLVCIGNYNWVAEDNKKVLKWRYTLANIYTRKVYNKWISNQKIIKFKEAEKNNKKIRSLESGEVRWLYKNWKVSAYKPKISFK